MINERLQLLVTTESQSELVVISKDNASKNGAGAAEETAISDLLKNVEDGSAQLKHLSTELKQEIQRNDEILRGPVVPPPADISIPATVNPTEEDKLTKMKQRKEAKKERAKKKVKTVIVAENQETPYDFEKVLESLGEVLMILVIKMRH